MAIRAACGARRGCGSPDEAAVNTLCRDCGAIAARDRRSAAGACGSPRLVHHAQLERLSIAHLDCDAFYATVEKRDRPELADRPVIVGGGARGVVLACCYVARLYGVRSAMPMFKALAACPDAVVIRPDYGEIPRGRARGARRDAAADPARRAACRSTRRFSTSAGPSRFIVACPGPAAGRHWPAGRRRCSASPCRSGSATTNSSPRSPPISTSRAVLL